MSSNFMPIPEQGPESGPRAGKRSDNTPFAAIKYVSSSFGAFSRPPRGKSTFWLNIYVSSGQEVGGGGGLHKQAFIQPTAWFSEL
jgi:hypothetical protein